MMNGKKMGGQKTTGMSGEQATGHPQLAGMGMKKSNEK